MNSLKMLEAFTKHVKRLCQCAMDADDAAMFDASKVPGRALYRLGVANSLPAMRCLIELTPEVQLEIDKEILRAKGLTRKATEEIISNGSDVELKPIAVRQKHNWSGSVKELRRTLNIWTERDPKEAIRPRVQIKRKCEEGEYHFLQCIKCKHWSSADRKAFDDRTLDAKTVCAKCKKASLVRNWLCKCQVEWHTCEQHANAPTETKSCVLRRKCPVAKQKALKSKKATLWTEAKQSTAKRSKVTLWEKAPDSTEVELCEDLSSSKRCLVPSKLPPRLRRRLYHDVQT